MGRCCYTVRVDPEVNRSLASNRMDDPQLGCYLDVAALDFASNENHSGERRTEHQIP